MSKNSANELQKTLVALQKKLDTLRSTYRTRKENGERYLNCFGFFFGTAVDKKWYAAGDLFVTLQNTKYNADKNSFELPTPNLMQVDKYPEAVLFGRLGKIYRELHCLVANMRQFNAEHCQPVSSATPLPISAGD